MQLQKKPPAEVMFARRVNLRFDLIKKYSQTFPDKTNNKVDLLPNNARNLKIGEQVVVRDVRYLDKNVFVKGVVERKLGNVTYIIQTSHHLWKRHINQLYKIGKRHPVLVNTQQTCKVSVKRSAKHL